jgi:hypothetical protein
LRWSQVRAGYEQAVLVLLGLGVTLPIFLAPGSLSGPRLGDVALAGALPLMVVEWRRMTAMHRAAGPAAAVFLTVTLLLQASQVGERLNAGDVVFWFRWIAAALVAPAVASLILRDVGRRRVIFSAMLFGAVCHLATYGFAALFGLEALQAVGLASPRALATTANAQVRLTTLAEHPNAAMAMLGLAVPAAGMLAGRTAMAAGYAAAIMGFVSTLSRGGLAAAVLAAAAQIVVRPRRPDRIATAWVLAGIVFIGAGVLAMQLGWVDLDLGRFAGRVDPAALETNLAGRAATWLRTVDSIIERPMGAGWSSASEMGTFRGLSVSHNAYLFMGRTVGVAGALTMMGLHLWSAARFDALTPLSIYLLAMMFSEDMTQGAGFVFLACLVAALAWRKRVAR